VGTSGGEIRHTEIRSDSSTNSIKNQMEDDHVEHDNHED
jgi:hypothetical protein